MTTKIRWAPRVPMEWIKRLYDQDARAIVDDELLDKVGYRLYERCRDCMLVVDTITGVWACPICRSPAEVTGGTNADRLSCSECGFGCTLEELRLSWRHKEINADTTFLRQFESEWDAARSSRQKMLAIDGVIHRWHHETKLAEKGAVGRPLGVNPIEGSRKQVIAFLDRLTAGENHDRWSKHHSDVKRGVRDG